MKKTNVVVFNEEKKMLSVNTHEGQKKQLNERWVKFTKKWGKNWEGARGQGV